MFFSSGAALSCWLTTVVLQVVLQGASAESGLLEIKRGLLPAAASGASQVHYTRPPAVGSDGAFEDCPCLATHSSPGYGSCKVWEAPQGEEGHHGGRCNNTQLLGALSYECGARWCYVDKSNCKRETLESGTRGLAFSFATCGNISHHVFMEEPVWQSSKLKVWADGCQMNSNPMHTGAYFFKSQAMLVFADEVLKKLGVRNSDVVYQNLSEAARNTYPNAYTACVYDIALGNIDLCAGVCFDTPLRRDFRVPFSSTIFSETFHLVVPSSQPSPLMKSLQKPFTPFTPGLWLCIVLVIIFAGLSELIFDEGFFSHVVERDEDGEIPSVQKIFFESIVSFLSQGLSYSPETLSGRLFAVGYGFFILVVGASYTANLASILITKKGVLISSIEDALSAGKKICYYTGTEKSLKAKFPGLEKLGVTVNNMEHIPEKLEEETCWAAIMAEDWLWTSQAANRLCGYQLTDNVLLSVPAGYWVSERMADVVNWQVANDTVHGTWERVAGSTFRQSMCTNADAATTALEVHHCISVMAVVGVFFVLALFLRAWELGQIFKSARSLREEGSEYTSERSHDSLGS